MREAGFQQFCDVSYSISDIDLMITFFKAIGIHSIYVAENPSGNELHNTWNEIIKPKIIGARKKNKRLLVLIHYTGHGCWEKDGLTSLILNEES